MKKIFNFILSFILIFIFTVGLASCKNTLEYDPDNFIEDVNNPMIVKEPITIKVFVPKHSLHSSYSTMALFTEATRITNINFEFIEADIDTLEEKRALMWESDEDELPDLFLFGNEVSEQISLSLDEAIIPIEDLIDKYCPNYKALMEEFDIDSYSRLNDGHIYSFASIKDVPRDLTIKEYVNTELLAQAGIEEAPTNLVELKDALKAMKNAVPIKDRANFSAMGSVKLSDGKSFILSAFGYVGSGIEVKHDGSNEVVYVPNEDEYKAYIKYCNELYKEGLLDKDVFETTQNKLIQKGEAGSLGMFDYAADFLVVGNENANKYEAIGPLTSGGYDGINNENKVWISYASISPTVAIIPSSTPYYREIARLMDFFYSEYAIELLIAGIEGVHYKWTDDSKTSWYYNIDEDTTNVEIFRGTFSPNVGIGACFYWKKEFVYKQESEQIDQLNIDSENYSQYFTEAFPSYVKFTEEELLEKATIERSLNDYVQTFEITYIKGTDGANIEDDWQEHLNTLKKLKVDRLIEIYQNALNRSLNE